MKITDAQAYNIIRSVRPDLTHAEALVVQATARMETNYGQGWGAVGAGSKNWGAITGTGPAGYFIHADSRPDPKNPSNQIQYTTKFRKYYTDEEAAADVARVALKPNVRAAANEGSLYGVAKAMRDNVYYTGWGTKEHAIGVREGQLRDHVAKITANASLTNPFDKTGGGNMLQPLPIAETNTPLAPPIPPAPKWVYYFQQARPSANAALVTQHGWLSNDMLSPQARAAALANRRSSSTTYLAWCEFDPLTNSFSTWHTA